MEQEPNEVTEHPEYDFLVPAPIQPNPGTLIEKAAANALANQQPIFIKKDDYDSGIYRNLITGFIKDFENAWAILSKSIEIFEQYQVRPEPLETKGLLRKRGDYYRLSNNVAIRQKKKISPNDFNGGSTTKPVIAYFDLNTHKWKILDFRKYVHQTLRFFSSNPNEPWVINDDGFASMYGGSTIERHKETLSAVVLKSGENCPEDIWFPEGRLSEMLAHRLSGGNFYDFSGSPLQLQQAFEIAKRQDAGDFGAVTELG